MVQRRYEKQVICHKPLKNTKIKTGSVIREPLYSEHKASYRICLGEFTEFILEVVFDRDESPEAHFLAAG